MFSRGFTLIELLLALLILSFAFLPMFNLFRYGAEGTQSTRMETEGANYAGDILNAFRTLSYQEVKTQLGADLSGSPKSHAYTDAEICGKLKQRFKLEIPLVKKPFSRQVTIVEFQGQANTLLGILIEKLRRLQAVPCFLVIVDIDFEPDGVQRRKPETFRMATVVSKP